MQVDPSSLSEQKAGTWRVRKFKDVVDCLHCKTGYSTLFVVIPEFNFTFACLWNSQVDEAKIGRKILETLVRGYVDSALVLTWRNEDSALVCRDFCRPAISGSCTTCSCIWRSRKLLDSYCPCFDCSSFSGCWRIFVLFVLFVLSVCLGCLCRLCCLCCLFVCFFRSPTPFPGERCAVHHAQPTSFSIVLHWSKQRCWLSISGLLFQHCMEHVFGLARLSGNRGNRAQRPNSRLRANIIWEMGV
jgi:hypothetical protein